MFAYYAHRGLLLLFGIEIKPKFSIELMKNNID